MKEFCDCADWKNIKRSNPTVFSWDKDYGWLIAWIELTDEVSHKQINKYGISIKNCPMCGKKLEEP